MWQRRERNIARSVRRKRHISRQNRLQRKRGETYRDADMCCVYKFVGKFAFCVCVSSSSSRHQKLERERERVAEIELDPPTSLQELEGGRVYLLVLFSGDEAGWKGRSHFCKIQKKQLLNFKSLLLVFQLRSEGKGIKRMRTMDGMYEESPLAAKKAFPAPPPLPCRATCCFRQKGLVMGLSPIRGHNSSVSTATADMWTRLFDEAYRADVIISTANDGIIYAHANILGMASPVLKGMLKQSKPHGRHRSISIKGAPHEAVRVFIRYLYSSSYEQEELEELAVHLLVLSHVFMIPQLKRLCERQLENGMLNIDNVTDIFQLALLCDAPRLSFISHRMIMNHFKPVATTEGWKAMKESHPVLEQVLLESVIEVDTSRKDRLRKLNERKIYLQLYEAMEALVHICRDGCRTIGPHDKVFKQDNAPCKFGTCKGLESLVRHFAGCKLRVPGGCIHCKRMWQLLELHSRLCANSEVCRVPLCRNFKDRTRKQSKKDDIKWRILVGKILRVKRIGGSPFFSSVTAAPL